MSPQAEDRVPLETCRQSQSLPGLGAKKGVEIGRSNQAKGTGKWRQSQCRDQGVMLLKEVFTIFFLSLLFYITHGHQLHIIAGPSSSNN